jgi:hypothetical protein
MPTGDAAERAVFVQQSGASTAGQGTAAALSGAWPVKVTDGTNVQPTGDSSARSIHVTQDNAAGQGTAAGLTGAWPVKVTDGTNVQPTGDSSARSIHVTTDNAAGQGTAAALAGAWPVKLTDGMNQMPTADSITRALYAKLSDGNASPYFSVMNYFANAVGAPVTVNAGNVRIYGLTLINNDAAVVWVEFFNTTTPTLGTTAPLVAFPIPASGALTLPTGMVTYTNQSGPLSMAAVTAYNGSTTGSVSGTVFYK